MNTYLADVPRLGSTSPACFRYIKTTLLSLRRRSMWPNAKLFLREERCYCPWLHEQFVAVPSIVDCTLNKCPTDCPLLKWVRIVCSSSEAQRMGLDQAGHSLFISFQETTIWYFYWAKYDLWILWQKFVLSSCFHFFFNLIATYSAPYSFNLVLASLISRLLLLHHSLYGLSFYQWIKDHLRLEYRGLSRQSNPSVLLFLNWCRCNPHHVMCLYIKPDYQKDGLLLTVSRQVV